MRNEQEILQIEENNFLSSWFYLLWFICISCDYRFPKTAMCSIALQLPSSLVKTVLAQYYQDYKWFSILRKHFLGQLLQHNNNTIVSIEHQFSKYIPIFTNSCWYILQNHLLFRLQSVVFPFPMTQPSVEFWHQHCLSEHCHSPLVFWQLHHPPAEKKHYRVNFKQFQRRDLANTVSLYHI